MLEGSFQKLISVVKGPDGPHAFRVLFWGPLLVVKGSGDLCVLGLLCLVRKAFVGLDCVLGHETFTVLPTIVWWGTMGSTLGRRFSVNFLH